MQKQIIKIFFILAVFLMLPNFVLAAPSVNAIGGIISNGQQVTISGSGFNSKSQATPLIWDDFSTGNNGDLLELHGGWKVATDNPTGQRPQLSTTKLRYTGDVFSAKFHFYSDIYYQWDLAYKNNLPVTGAKRFVDYWMHYKMPTQLVGSTQHQLKLFKLMTGREDDSDGFGGPGADGFPALNTYAWRYNDGGRETYFVSGATADNFSTQSTAGIFTDNDWTHVRMQIDMGSVGNANGILKAWFNNELVYDASNINFIAAGYGGLKYFDNFQIGKYLGNTSGATTDIYFGEVYYDTSWSRVEIGNNAIYTNCTHTEIQPYTEWADGSISIAVNKGAFNQGENAYLFVVDANGNASAGKQITFGSSQTSTCIDSIQNGSETGIDCGGSCPVCIQTYSISNLLTLVSNWLKVGTVSDVNSDNIVDTRDLGIMMSKWQ